MELGYDLSTTGGTVRLIGSMMFGEGVSVSRRTEIGRQGLNEIKQQLVREAQIMGFSRAEVQYVRHPDSTSANASRGVNSVVPINVPQLFGGNQ
jgi:hypothetical protein